MPHIFEMNFNIRMSRAMSNLWIIRLASFILLEILKSARESHTQNCNIIVNNNNDNDDDDEDDGDDGKYVWCQFAPLKIRPERWFRQFISTSCYHSSMCFYVCINVCSLNLLCIHLCILSIPLGSLCALFIPFWMANSHNSQYKSRLSLFGTPEQPIRDNLVYIFCCIALYSAAVLMCHTIHQKIALILSKQTKYNDKILVCK